MPTHHRPAVFDTHDCTEQPFHNNVPGALHFCYQGRWYSAVEKVEAAPAPERLGADARSAGREQPSPLLEAAKREAYHAGFAACKKLLLKAAPQELGENGCCTAAEGPEYLETLKAQLNARDFTIRQLDQTNEGLRREVDATCKKLKEAADARDLWLTTAMNARDNAATIKEALRSVADLCSDVLS